MKFDYNLDAAKTLLQDKLKARYEPGPMRPMLCEAFEKGITSPKLQWMFYAGMGDVGFHDATDIDTRAAKELIKDGYLVTTFEYDHYSAKYRTIKHFDDVNFGLEENGGIVIYELV